MNIEELKNNLAELLDEKQVSELLGIPLGSLRSWRYNKRNLPYIKLGQKVRYRASDIVNFLNKCVVLNETSDNVTIVNVDKGE